MYCRAEGNRQVRGRYIFPTPQLPRVCGIHFFLAYFMTHEYTHAHRNTIEFFIHFLVTHSKRVFHELTTVKSFFTSFSSHPLAPTTDSLHILFLFLHRRDSTFSTLDCQFRKGTRVCLEIRTQGIRGWYRKIFVQFFFQAFNFSLDDSIVVGNFVV